MQANDPPPAAAAPPRLYWIDWLRFLAAAAVLLDHACQWNWAGPDLSARSLSPLGVRLLFFPAHLGRQAVVVFFVLSGALVGGLTLRKICAGTFDATVYAADRLARVYVPLIPALLLTAAILQSLDALLDPAQYFVCLLGMQRMWAPLPIANNVLWTLAYEIWFYVLMGCAAVAVTPRDRPAGARLLALAGVALSLYLLCFRLEWIYLVCWLFGAGGFWLCDRIRPTARPLTAALGAAVMLAGVALSRPDLLAAAFSIPDPGRWLPLPAGGNFFLAIGTLVFLPRSAGGHRRRRLEPGSNASARVRRRSPIPFTSRTSPCSCASPGSTRRCRQS